MKKVTCYILLSVAISGCGSFGMNYQDIGNGKFTTRGWNNDEADKNAIAHCKSQGKSRVVEKLVPALNPNCTGAGLCDSATLTFSCK